MFFIFAGSVYGLSNTLSNYRVHLEEDLYLPGSWVCGVAEVILPPRLASRSASAEEETPSEGEHNGAQSPDTPLLPHIEEKEGRQEETPQTQTADGQRIDTQEEESGAAEESEEAPRGPGLGASSASGIPPVVEADQHYLLSVPPTPPVTLRQILEQSYGSVTRSTPQTRLEAEGILAALKALEVPQFLYNVADPETESTSELILQPSGDRVQFAYEEKSQLQDFISNLASYASSPQQAGQWLGEAVSIWTELLAGSTGPAQRVRRDVETSEPPIDPALRIFLYCDVIQSSLCSDFKGRCLRILTAGPRDSGSQILFPVYYFPCEKNIITGVHVELKTKAGDYVHFQDSPHPTIIVLHFRRLA